MEMNNKQTNPDIDEQEEGVSYEKGLEFEKQFASFMKQELNWDKIRVGAHMTGKNNAKGTSIDILGERLDALGIKYKDMFLKWIYASGFFIFLSIIYWLERWGEGGHWFLIFSLISLSGGLIFYLLNKINYKQNAWVECKNLKSRATVSHINKMLNEYNDFKESKNDDYTFTHLYFASANGYVENALKMAMDNNIICYVKKENSFKQINYFQ